MEKYKIISAATVSELTLLVNQELTAGFDCIGGPFMSADRLLNQALKGGYIQRAEKKRIPSELPSIQNDLRDSVYMIQLKFRPKEGQLDTLIKVAEEYLIEFPYNGLTFFSIYDLENDNNEYAILEYIDTTAHYLEAIDRGETNPFLGRLRPYVDEYDDGQHFKAHHGILIKNLI